MAVIAGCQGLVKADGVTLAHVRRWSFNWVAEAKPYSSSSTNCTKQRTAGPKDVQGGRFEVYIDTVQPIEGDVVPGDIVTLLLYDNSSRFWTITSAVITGIEPSAEIEEGDNAAANVTFEGGTVTVPA